MCRRRRSIFTEAKDGGDPLDEQDVLRGSICLEGDMPVGEMTGEGRRSPR